MNDRTRISSDRRRGDIALSKKEREYVAESHGCPSPGG